MTEVAIKFKLENETAMLATEAIAPEMLSAKLEEYGPGNVYERCFGYTYYFIPDHTTYTGNRLGWTIVRSDAFEQCFTADMTKIETEFVECTQHSPI